MVKPAVRFIVNAEPLHALMTVADKSLDLVEAIDRAPRATRRALAPLRAQLDALHDAGHQLAHTGELFVDEAPMVPGAAPES